ncbi:MAG: hypothetical protein ACK6C0_08125, partial [Betaproteobacteria bacterium]
MALFQCLERNEMRKLDSLELNAITGGTAGVNYTYTIYQGGGGVHQLPRATVWGVADGRPANANDFGSGRGGVESG